MPISKDQAREVLRRLTQWGTVDELAKRLEPISEEARPLAPGVPRPGDWSGEARDLRVAALEAQGISIPHLAGREPQADPASLRGNIEHYIGMTQVPTGLIGPLRVNGVHAHGDYLVPLATTEGARLASRAGGISALVTTEQVQRAPGFVFANIAEASHFAAWAIGHFERFREV